MMDTKERAFKDTVRRQLSADQFEKPQGKGNLLTP
jgi:hypothetical protein